MSPGTALVGVGCVGYPVLVSLFCMTPCELWRTLSCYKHSSRGMLAVLADTTNKRHGVLAELLCQHYQHCMLACISGWTHGHRLACTFTHGQLQHTVATPKSPTVIRERLLCGSSGDRALVS